MTSSLEPISPELALICPETRQRARERLPVLDPDGFVPLQTRARHAKRHSVVLTAARPAHGAPLRSVAITAATYALLKLFALVVQGVALISAILLGLTLAADG